MEVEVRKYKGVILDLEGVILDLEGVTVTKSSFDKPRIAYYRVKLYDADKKATIDLLNVDPKEIKIIQ